MRERVLGKLSLGASKFARLRMVVKSLLPTRAPRLHPRVHSSSPRPGEGARGECGAYKRIKNGEAIAAVVAAGPLRSMRRTEDLFAHVSYLRAPAGGEAHGEAHDDRHDAHAEASGGVVLARVRRGRHHAEGGGDGRRSHLRVELELGEASHGLLLGLRLDREPAGASRGRGVVHEGTGDGEAGSEDEGGELHS